MDCSLPDSSIMGFSRQEYWSTMPWKEIEENKRMEKTRDLFRKIRETKGTLHAKMGTTKDRKVWTKQKQKLPRRGGKNTQRTIQKIS